MSFVLKEEAPFEVSLRFRPCKKETNALWSSYISSTGSKHELAKNLRIKDMDWDCLQGKNGKGNLQFDRIFEEFVDNFTVFDQFCLPQVKRVLQGYNANILTYGAPKSGKTFSLFGLDDEHEGTQYGIAQQALQYILTFRDSVREQKQVSVFMSFLEVSGEDVLDLFNVVNSSKRSLSLRETQSSGVYIEGLSRIKIESLPDFERALSFAFYLTANAHTCLKLTVEIKEVNELGESEKIRSSALTFFDLVSYRTDTRDVPPSEISRTQIVREQHLLLKNIVRIANKSIAAGKMRKQEPLPIQESNLSYLLKPVLLGEEYTGVLCTLGSSLEEMENTRESLEFAAAIAGMKSSVIRNRSFSFSEAIETYKRRIEALEQKIILQENHLNEKDLALNNFIRLDEGDDSSKLEQFGDPTKLARQNQLLRFELRKLQAQVKETKKIEKFEASSFHLTNSLQSSSSTASTSSTQTEQNEFTIFGQIVRHLMDKFPELKQRIIGAPEFMQLFLLYTKMQSDLVQEIHSNAGFPVLRTVVRDPQSINAQSSRGPASSRALQVQFDRPKSAGASTMKVEDLIERSDFFTSQDDDFLSALSRESESILSVQSKRNLEKLMNYDVGSPLDTQKVQDFIQKEKERDDRSFKTSQKLKDLEEVKVPDFFSNREVPGKVTIDEHQDSVAAHFESFKEGSAAMNSPGFKLQGPITKKVKPLDPLIKQQYFDKKDPPIDRNKGRRSPFSLKKERKPSSKEIVKKPDPIKVKSPVRKGGAEKLEKQPPPGVVKIPKNKILMANDRPRVSVNPPKLPAAFFSKDEGVKPSGLGPLSPLNHKVSSLNNKATEMKPRSSSRIEPLINSPKTNAKISRSRGSKIELRAKSAGKNQQIVRQSQNEKPLQGRYFFW